MCAGEPVCGCGIVTKTGLSGGSWKGTGERRCAAQDIPKSASASFASLVTDERQRRTERRKRQTLRRILTTEKERRKMYEANKIEGVSVKEILLQTKTVE